MIRSSCNSECGILLVQLACRRTFSKFIWSQKWHLLGSVGSEHPCEHGVLFRSVDSEHGIQLVELVVEMDYLVIG